MRHSSCRFAEPGPRFLRVTSNRGHGSAAHRHSASKTRVNALMAKSYALRCVRGTDVSRVPGAMQRVALAKRCSAEPGPRFLRVVSNRDPGSAAHRFAKSYALRCVRGTRHCEPTGRRGAPPDDKLREAIQSRAREGLDCFVATLLAMTVVYAAQPPSSSNTPGTGNPRHRPASAAARSPRRTSTVRTGCRKIPCRSRRRRGGARSGLSFLTDLS
jgi:hypothetical protein